MYYIFNATDIPIKNHGYIKNKNPQNKQRWIMLDEKTLALLKTIDLLSPDQGYKIFETRELASAMPEDFAVDSASVREMIDKLAAREYISVKYEDDNEICLKPLAKCKLAYERLIDEEVISARTEKRFFTSAFVGAACGGGAIALLCAIISLIARALC